MEELQAGMGTREDAALWVVKDSQVEISMIGLWPLEAWCKFLVASVCLKGLPFRTTEKMTHRECVATASASLNWAGLLRMAAQAVHCTTQGRVLQNCHICKTVTCMAPPGIAQCRDPVEENHISALVSVKCVLGNSVTDRMLSESQLLA